MKFAAICLIMCLTAAAASLATVPGTISYQGLLEETGGTSLPDGDYSVTFRIYDDAAGGTVLWSETQVVALEDGVFSAQLGSATPLTLAFDIPYWISLQVGAEPELTRLAFTSTPYAFRAVVADSLAGGGGGGDITAVIASNGLTGGAASGDATLTVGAGPGLTVEPDLVRLAEPYLSGEAYDGRFVNEAQANSITSAMVTPAMVSSIAGVENDGGDIDLIAGTGITITPDNANNRITFTASGSGIGGSGTADYLPKFTGSSTIGSSTVYDDGSAVGIGTTSPDARLSVSESTSGIAFEAITHYGDTAARTVNFERTAAIFANNDLLQLKVPATASENAQFIECEAGNGGIQFRVHTNGDTEVHGDLAVDGTHDVVSHGMRAGSFETDLQSSGVHALYAEYTGAGQYDNIAVYGKSTPAEGYGYGGKFEGGYYGVYGRANSTGNGSQYGVRAFAGNGSGLNFGVRGTAAGPGSNFGVYGEALGGETNWAGWFAGDLMVTGTLSKGAGSFQIDHPLEPEDKYLYHSFVESPDMMNVYNGNVVLDGNGQARVQMPDWFEALNRDFRYQLTPIGAPADLYILQEMLGNEFAIAGGAPGMKVSWQVTGIRQDPYAQAHRIPVEQDKPVHERGKYLHPDLYGQPETLAVDHVPERHVSAPVERYESSRARHAAADPDDGGAR